MIKNQIVHICRKFHFISESVRSIEVFYNFLEFEKWRREVEYLRLSVCFSHLSPLLSFMHNLLNILGIYNSFSIETIETVNWSFSSTCRWGNSFLLTANVSFAHLVSWILLPENYSIYSLHKPKSVQSFLVGFETLRRLWNWISAGIFVCTWNEKS